MPKNTSSPKLIILEVIKEAYRLYKENFSTFIKVSGVYFVIRIFSRITRHFSDLSLDNGSSFTLNSTVLFVVAILLLYLQIKTIVSLYICISERYQSHKIKFIESFAKSKGKVKDYAVLSMLILLIILIPSLGALFSYNFIEIASLQQLLTITFLFLILYMGTIYSFAPVIGILEEEKHNYLEKSNQLVGSYFLKVAFLRHLNIILAIPYYYLVHILGVSLINEFFLFTVSRAIFIFIMPFTYAITVVMYYKLKEING
ncbi:hypothetical protein [Fuchsiella alkaliacetigena]|uniref:hypothetical protein n=1 Tax=Fuchsiella alkaliacetigena TaxID=957042 RepID=UPI00200A283E|nr:hypothetical protein [Fuchsiella alkaliacetigena]MCK8825957.1 hypothetical protein [Fuchsiella alkaliacetigena]